MQTHTRLLSAFILTTAMAFGAAVPRYSAAQQTSDQAARQAADSVVQAHNKAFQAKDAAAAAALYSEDVIEVTPDGPLVGRGALEKNFAELLKIFTPEPAKLDQVVMIGDAMRLRTGTWEGVIQSPNGPVPVKGYWATTDVREGNSWKIRMETALPMSPPPAEQKK
jgi:uncharacterized protein (TIGR02246 family)